MSIDATIQALAESHERCNARFAEALALLPDEQAANILLNPVFKSLFDYGFVAGREDAQKVSARVQQLRNERN